MHGLSTLNRLLGKKNKEVSRSTSNLSKSHSNLESSSQHNKKIPILNNAPFEQTFRVTVYLPKNQLYVERIGAKTKLEKLMNDVCDSKSLSIDKYEFRHPADMSQVYDNDKTVGEVGLNELRLVLKTESRYNGDFHRYHSQPDEIMKYKSSNAAESISSSEISRSIMKNASKTSPYSSTNSLNSLDSTGMNSSGKTQPPIAPIRKKKRMAPRPPSENSIQEIFTSTTLNVFKEPHSILPRKNFHVSSPQLYNNTNNNNNNYEIAQKSDSNNNNTELRSISNRLNAITRPSSLHFGSSTEIVKNLPERQRNNSESSEIQNILRESGSKQNSLERAKKKNPAPVPPTRKLKPTPSPRTIQDDMNIIAEIQEVDEQQENINQQKLVGEILSEIDKLEDENGNVSKVLLNNTDETAQPTSLESEGPISIQIISSEVKNNVEQQSVKLPVVSKVHISHQEMENDQHHRDDERRSSSEEEEEMTVNIYNVTTKSVVTCESKVTETNDSSFKYEEKHVTIEKTSNNVKEETTTAKDNRSPSPEWTYTLPAPPVLSSIDSSTSPTDHHEKSVVDNKYFSDYTSVTVHDNETILSDTTVVSAETHIQPIINDRRKDFIMDTKPLVDNQSDKSGEVITSDLEDGYLGNNNNKQITNDNEISVIEESQTKLLDDSLLQKSRLLTITRSDSFHSIGQQQKKRSDDDYELTRRSNVNALPQRSTSFLSLVHSQKAEMRSATKHVPYNRQKSTSELSISDVPSLQSLEVIKNILNCRKASLHDNPPGDAPIIEEQSKNESTLMDEKATAATKIEAPSSTAVTKIEVKSTEKVIYSTSSTTITEKKKLETQKSESECNNNKDMSNKKSEVAQWRYSGPPKINFSTWNERPKVDVAVMSDEDYIFGGVSNSTLPRPGMMNNSQNQYSTADTVDSVIRHNNHNNNNHKEAERHLPKVLGVEYKKDINPVMLRNNNNNSSINDRNIKPRPVTIDYNSVVTVKPINSPTNYQNQFVSFNRLTVASNSSNNNNSNNNIGKKFTPIVHGFSATTTAKLDNISETQSNVKSLPITNNKIMEASEKKPEAPMIPVKPSYLRSTSAGNNNNNNIVKLSTAKMPTTAPIVDGDDEKPFSQTLRRTGLIEKMLNDDKKTESMFGRVIDKPKNIVEEKVTMRQYSQPVNSAPPPPPPPMIFRKSAPIIVSSSSRDDADVRSQLFDAIKNFNKDSLRRK